MRTINQSININVSHEIIIIIIVHFIIVVIHLSFSFAPTYAFRDIFGDLLLLFGLLDFVLLLLVQVDHIDGLVEFFPLLEGQLLIQGDDE